MIIHKGFSEQWDDVYIRNEQNTSWPWSDLVSLVHRYGKNIINKNHPKVLELGCGPGANIDFLLSLNFSYFAIEGSKEIVGKLHNKYPSLIKQITIGDFSNKESFPYFDFFDLIVDRAALTHNNQKSIESSLSLILNSLLPGGFFIGVDWFSVNHSDSSLGETGGDLNTRNKITSGQFSGVGNVHFSDEAHLRKLFLEFDILLLEEKVLKKHEPKNEHQFSSWNIVARRRIN